ncbi:hypothetical protein BJV78DRAFT_1179643 [Lactifluus subvellereus]|nr:hypothetical protein BJV78DRAFT_1179643 [Lactifluus subvellereus]
MDSASSKVASASSGKKGKLPSWTGARIPPHDPRVSPLPTARQPWVSEPKMKRDAKGPQLLANLSRPRVGAVRVDYHMQTARTVSFD